MANDPDNHAEDGIGRRAEHRADEASDSHRRRRTSCTIKPFTLTGTTDTRTLSTSETGSGCHRARHAGRLADGADSIAAPAPRRVRHGV
jgi:hypothetical protein